MLDKPCGSNDNLVLGPIGTLLDEHAGVPLQGCIELTARCNFDCKMCFVHISDAKYAKSKELSTEEWLRIVKEAVDSKGFGRISSDIVQ